MLFEVTVSQRGSLFGSFTSAQVEADSAEVAGSFVLSQTKKDWPSEKRLYVSRVTQIGTNFIGKATQHSVQRTAKRAGKK